MSDAETLKSFGFSEAKIKRALKATKNSGLQQALDWLQDHQDDGDDVVDDDVADHMDTDAGASVEGEAKSLRCVECGKIFKTPELASFHGTKSGHDQFEESTEEIKPLTEAEKAEKLQEMRQRLALKRADQAKKDVEESKNNEALRRKGGKEQQAFQAELEKKEADKQAALRVKEKAEDAKARAAVKAQIAADKKARADKAAREKAAREGLPPPVVQETEPAAKPVTTSTAASTRLQIRTGTGPIIHTFPSETKLSEVVEFIQGKGVAVNTLSSLIPRKSYTDVDFGMSLQELGLSPSAVLVVS